MDVFGILSEYLLCHIHATVSNSLNGSRVDKHVLQVWLNRSPRKGTPQTRAIGNSATFWLVPLWGIFKNFLGTVPSSDSTSLRALQELFPGPRCGSRQA